MIRSEHTLVVVLCAVLVGLAVYQHVLLRWFAAESGGV